MRIAVVADLLPSDLSFHASYPIYVLCNFANRRAASSCGADFSGGGNILGACLQQKFLRPLSPLRAVGVNGNQYAAALHALLVEPRLALRHAQAKQGSGDFSQHASKSSSRECAEYRTGDDERAYTRYGQTNQADKRSQCSSHERSGSSAGGGGILDFVALLLRQIIRICVLRVEHRNVRIAEACRPQDLYTALHIWIGRVNAEHRCNL